MTSSHSRLSTTTTHAPCRSDHSQQVTDRRFYQQTPCSTLAASEPLLPLSSLEQKHTVLAHPISVRSPVPNANNEGGVLDFVPLPAWERFGVEQDEVVCFGRVRHNSLWLIVCK